MPPQTQHDSSIEQKKEKRLTALASPALSGGAVCSSRGGGRKKGRGSKREVLDGETG